MLANSVSPPLLVGFLAHLGDHRVGRDRLEETIDVDIAPAARKLDVLIRGTNCSSSTPAAMSTPLISAPRAGLTGLAVMVLKSVLISVEFTRPDSWFQTMRRALITRHEG
jgi:hypothetical protein